MEKLKKHLNDNGLVLKAGDDQFPRFLSYDTQSEDLTPTFRIENGDKCSWSKNTDGLISSYELRRHIKPWLTALCHSERLALLVGSGLTYSVQNLATEKTLAYMDSIEFSVFNEEVTKAVKQITEKVGRSPGNFEDQLRVAQELLRGLEIATLDQQQDDSIYQQKECLRDDLKSAMNSFIASILHGERILDRAPKDKREKAFGLLVNFLVGFASRPLLLERLHIFTTNYDRIVEAGADVAGLRLIDRFVGLISPSLRASRLNVDFHFDPPGIRGEPRYLEGVVRFTKLHGSIDWMDCGSDIRRIGLPFGADAIDPFLSSIGNQQKDTMKLMVYPNSAKDRETSEYPYVELFRDFAAAICQPNTTVITYGYSFGDDHINRVIADMLTIPSTHLAIISFDDPLGRIMACFERFGRPSQLSLMIGHHFADLRTLVDYLPTHAIDRTTSRMTELLRTQGYLEKFERDGVQIEPSEDQGAH